MTVMTMLIVTKTITTTGMIMTMRMMVKMLTRILLKDDYNDKD